MCVCCRDLTMCLYGHVTLWLLVYDHVPFLSFPIQTNPSWETTSGDKYKFNYRWSPGFLFFILTKAVNQLCCFSSIKLRDLSIQSIIGDHWLQVGSTVKRVERKPIGLLFSSSENRSLFVYFLRHFLQRVVFPWASAAVALQIAGAAAAAAAATQSVAHGCVSQQKKTKNAAAWWALVYVDDLQTFVLHAIVPRISYRQWHLNTINKIIIRPTSSWHSFNWIVAAVDLSFGSFYCLFTPICY